MSMSASFIIGDVHPRISPGERGLAWGTVIDENPCFSFSSLAAVWREATNWIVLTKTNLGCGTSKCNLCALFVLDEYHFR